MPGSSGKNAVVKLGTAATPGTAVVLAGISNAAVGRSAPDVNVTSFGDVNQTHVKGIPDATVTLSGFLVAATDAQLVALVPVDTAVMTEIAPLGTGTGNPKYSGSFYVSDYSPTVPVDGAVAISATLLPAGSVTFGTY